MPDPTEPLTRRERRERKRQQQREDRGRSAARAKAKRWITTGLIVLVVGGGIGAVIWAAANQPTVAPEDIASPTSIHWHAELAITVQGERQPIPANVGVPTGSTGHPNVIHTHDDSGNLHMEFVGRVLKEQTKLKNFFSVWGKQLTPTCVLDRCNGADGTWTMAVNGEPSTAFGEYAMQEDDRIELRFE